jgi:hypothetical protein
VNRPVFAERAMVWPGAGAGRRAGEEPGDVLVRNQSSMMARVVSRMRRANGELVPLRAAAAGRRKSTSGGDARGPSAQYARWCAVERGVAAEAARRWSMRVALVRPGSAAQQQPTLGAGGDQGARAGPARRGRQVVSAGPRAARRPPQPILHGDRADVPGASRGQRAGAFASGGRRAAQVGVGGRCQGGQRARWCAGQAESGSRGREAPVHAYGVGTACERCAAAAGRGCGQRSGRESDECRSASWWACDGSVTAGTFADEFPPRAPAPKERPALGRGLTCSGSDWAQEQGRVHEGRWLPSRGSYDDIEVSFIRSTAD